MIQVYNVTSIYNQIVGHAGVCYPNTDAQGRYILSPTSLQDDLLAEIWSLIEACPLIEYEPVIPEGLN